MQDSTTRLICLTRSPVTGRRHRASVTGRQPRLTHVDRARAPQTSPAPYSASFWWAASYSLAFS
jgi:hypothetical protein